MKRASTFRIYLFITLVVFTHGLNGQINGFKKIHWEQEKIAPGLIWKSSHTVINDSIPQNINILIINLHKREIFLSYNPKKNLIISKQATEAGALAAVNAGFFNIRNGGSATYIRTGGQIVDTDTVKKWKRNSNMTGSVLVDKNSNVTIEKAETNSWYDNHPEYADVLVTGPLLLTGKGKTKLPETSLVINKHPRTSIGKRGSHTIILVTLDGRTDQAIGMTLGELTDLMISLRCKDAVNLDGGGSTTMWISGKPFNG
ncbi:MAG: phosphodiester glycosidase family protein, partial [Bacteroidales bacterium]|nr:phosphodiester glycosidase family protein [Bacteroidales bacterium]